MYEIKTFTNPNQSLIDRVALRREFIWQHGTSVPGTSPNHNPNVVPKWFNQTVFEHAQNLNKTYSFVFKLCQIYGLLLGVHLFPALTPLLATGQSKSISSIYLRYLSTNIHIHQWFTGGSPFDRGSPCYRSLKVVRSLHLQVSKEINQITEGWRLDNDDKQLNLWMSQYDMMNTQFAFVGFIAIFPKTFGLDPFSSSLPTAFSAYDLHCLLHFYRVIGYCLGIEDRFNLCQSEEEGIEGDKEVVELCRQIYYHHWKPRINAVPDEIGEAMAEGIGAASFQFAPFFTYRSLMHYVAPTFGLSDQAEFQLKTFSDYYFYALFSFVMSNISRSQFSMWIHGKLYFICAQLAFWCRHFHVWFLDWWYSGNSRYQFAANANNRCPFALKNYKYKAAWEHRLT